MADITVLMSVYNGMEFLPDAVHSILNQDFDDFVFLIINDGSTDEVKQYLDSVDDGRVQIVHQQNQGLGAALNRGISMVETKYMARMDADDVADKGRLRKQFQFMEENFSYVMIGSHFAFMLDDEHVGCSPPLPTSANDVKRVLFSGGHSLCHPTVFCRMDAVRAVGGYRIKGVGQDWDFFLRMAEIGSVGNLRDILLNYRLYSSSNAWKSSDKVIEGRAFALRNAKLRQMNECELSEVEFAEERKHLCVHQKISRKFQGVSMCFYRKSIILGLQGKHLSRYYYLSIASVCDPIKVLIRLFKLAR